MISTPIFWSMLAHDALVAWSVPAATNADSTRSTERSEVSKARQVSRAGRQAAPRHGKALFEVHRQLLCVRTNTSETPDLYHVLTTQNFVQRFETVREGKCVF